MSLFKSMEKFIQICQFTGIMPISYNKINWESNRSLEIIIFIAFTVTFMCLVIGFSLPTSAIMAAKTNLQIALNMFVLTVVSVRSFIILFETYFKRSHHKQLLITFNKLESIFKNHLQMELNYRQIKRDCNYSIMFWIIQVFGIDLVTITSLLMLNRRKTFNFTLINLYANLICETSYAYKSFQVSIIRENLNVLTKFLKWQIKGNGYYTRRLITTHLKSSDVKLDLKMLQFISRTYCKIWESSTIINYLTEWSLPISIFNEAFAVTYYAYFLLIFSINFDSSGFQTAILNIFFVIIILSRITNIVWLPGVCESTTEAVSLFLFFWQLSALASFY